jgi:hypothetical protein
MIDIVSRTAPTLIGWMKPLAPLASIEELWAKAFSLTFGAELRAERFGRSAALVEVDRERYRRFGEAAMEQASSTASRQQAERWWRRMQRHGKRYSIARLAKASFTFAGGAEYIAWKINRHAGANIELTPWQRRHPLLAGIGLLPRLLRSGAVR